MSDKHYIGLDLTGFEDRGEARPVSRVTLLVDDEHAITAGDDMGLELTGDCPHATQAMAEAILARVKGYRYKMYSAASANLDPAAELGDGVTAGGIYSVLSRISESGDGYPDLEAPGRAEPEDEFPTEGPVTKAFNRQMAAARASITRLSDEIELRVEKDGIIAAINLSSEEACIQAEKIRLEGLVTVNRTFQIDRDGYLRCSGGTVGGFTVGQSALYNGLSSLGGTDNGVYIGTDGISLGGGKFKVDSFGSLTASSGTFTGAVRANMVQVGGDNGYITGGQIGSGTVGGGNIAQSTISGGNIGYSTVTAGNLYDSYASQASMNTVQANIASFSRLLSGAALITMIHAKELTVDGLPTLGGYDTHWSTITTGGVSYTALCR